MNVWLLSLFQLVTHFHSAIRESGRVSGRVKAQFVIRKEPGNCHTIYNHKYTQTYRGQSELLRSYDRPIRVQITCHPLTLLMPIHKLNIIHAARLLLTKINILHKVVLQNMTFGYICGIEVFEYQSAPRTLFPNHNTTSRLDKSILCIKLLFFSFNYVDILMLSLLIISDQYPDSKMGGN